MRFLAGLILVVMMVQGVSVQAVAVGTTIAPDKAFYRPGEAVTLAIATGAAGAARARAGGDRVSHCRRDS